VLSYFLAALDSWLINMAFSIVATFLFGFLITLVMYYRNECKYLTLLQKENQSGEKTAS
jgi:hypothetical protein